MEEGRRPLVICIGMDPMMSKEALEIIHALEDSIHNHIHIIDVVTLNDFLEEEPLVDPLCVSVAELDLSTHAHLLERLIQRHLAHKELVVDTVITLYTKQGWADYLDYEDNYHGKGRGRGTDRGRRFPVPSKKSRLCKKGWVRMF